MVDGNHHGVRPPGKSMIFFQVVSIGDHCSQKEILLGALNDLLDVASQQGFPTPDRIVSEPILVRLSIETLDLLQAKFIGLGVLPVAVRAVAVASIRDHVGEEKGARP